MGDTMAKLTKVYLELTEEEKGVLEECMRLTQMTAASLLRLMLTQALRDLCSEIDKNQRLTCTFHIPACPIQSDAPTRNQIYTVTIDEESGRIYKQIQEAVPLTQKHFLTYLVMPYLRRVQINQGIWR